MQDRAKSSRLTPLEDACIWWVSPAVERRAEPVWNPRDDQGLLDKGAEDSRSRCNGNSLGGNRTSNTLVGKGLISPISPEGDYWSFGDGAIAWSDSQHGTEHTIG